MPEENCHAATNQGRSRLPKAEGRKEGPSHSRISFSVLNITSESKLGSFVVVVVVVVVVVLFCFVLFCFWLREYSASSGEDYTGLRQRP